MTMIMMMKCLYCDEGDDVNELHLLLRRTRAFTPATDSSQLMARNSELTTHNVNTATHAGAAHSFFVMLLALKTRPTVPLAQACSDQRSSIFKSSFELGTYVQVRGRRSMVYELNVPDK